MSLIYYCCACLHSFSIKKDLVDMSHEEMRNIMLIVVPESNINDIKEPVICAKCFENLKIAYDLKKRYYKNRRETRTPQDTRGQAVRPCSVALQRIDEGQGSPNK